MRKVILSALREEKLPNGIGRKVARGERLELVQYSYKRGACFPLHSHPSEQLTLVLCGRLVFTCAEPASDLVVEAGEAVFIPAGEPHGVFVPEDLEDEEVITYNVFTPVRATLPDGQP